MGTWGTRIFDNDTACDLALEISGLTPEQAEGRLLGALDSFGDQCDHWVMDEALAAADIVARRRGASGGQQDAYTFRVDQWVAKSRTVPMSPALVQAAGRVVDGVLANAEARAAVWNSRDSFEAWRDQVAQLRSRLGT